MILTGRFGYIFWEEQTDRDGTLPTNPSWKPVGIVRDLRVRVPAGTNILRSVGSLAAAGIVVAETAMDAAELTITVEGVGVQTKSLLQKALFNPSNHPNFPNQLSYLSAIFGRADECFRLVSAKVSRCEIDAPADRYVSATITLVGRYVEDYTKPSSLPSVPTQVFASKEGVCSWGEIMGARIRIDNRLDPVHTIKTTAGERYPDHIAELVTEISGELEVFWHDVGDVKMRTLSESNIQLTFTDWANSQQTMQITLGNAKPRDISLDIPAERFITGRIEFLATSVNIS